MIIKNKNVRLEACADEKRIQILQDGGVVRAIEVHCTCGETTVVELEYETGVEAPETSETKD